MLVPNTNTREHGRYRLEMTMKAPLRRGTRPVDAAQLAVEDTSTDGPEFAATPATYLLFYLLTYFSDKNLCRCFGAPARRVFPDHLITYFAYLMRRPA